MIYRKQFTLCRMARGLGPLFVSAVALVASGGNPSLYMSAIASQTVPLSEAETGPITLGNGVSVGSDCNSRSPSTAHLTFLARASHKFMGYGVNVQAAKAAAAVEKTVADIKKLGFVWVKLALADQKAFFTAPPQAGMVSLDSSLRAQVRADLPESNKKLSEALHAAGIKVVNTMFHAPLDYLEALETRSGTLRYTIKPEAIADFAQYYAAFLRALDDDGVRPDLVEILNEPNLATGKFTPEEYAEFLKDLERALQTPSSASRPSFNLSAPATAGSVPVTEQFLQAIEAAGALSDLKAITLHTYYVRDKPTNAGIPPADDPSFQELVATGKKLGIPVISTEFGGTDIKMMAIDPSRPSVDAAEELKAALDLIREGESAAIVWALYPNDYRGRVAKTWALIDEDGPTNAYWPFYVLARTIPVGADVLEVGRTDVTPTISSLGYAAFRSGRHVYVGLSNPDPSTPVASVAVDLSNLGAFSVTQVASFTPTRAMEQSTNIRAGMCALRVTVPSGTGAVLDILQ